jgi:adenosylcobyric acid synthase
VPLVRAPGPERGAVQGAEHEQQRARGARGDAGEIGSAQYFQALARACVPDVRMNPVLLKPERDTPARWCCMGRCARPVHGCPGANAAPACWPAAREAWTTDGRRHDVVVIEGAGSPAEINLAPADYVNMRVARWAAAGRGCLLVTDIDRGGAFAHLYGTWALLPPTSAALLRGFVLNRFRGDAGAAGARARSSCRR